MTALRSDVPCASGFGLLSSIQCPLFCCFSCYP
jgi:hypothetical protein